MNRRAVVYAAVFSVASYAVAAGMVLGTSSFALSIFADPFLTLTVPLILISVGIQVVNSRYGPGLIALFSSLLYAATGVLFLLPTFLVAGAVDEAVSRIVGYRGFRAVMVNTTLVGTLVGVLSVIFGILMLGVPTGTHDLSLYMTAFSLGYLGESALMGYLSHLLGSYLIKSGVIRGED
jgi:hypothetical protein